VRCSLQSLSPRILDSSFFSNPSTQLVDMMWGCTDPAMLGWHVSPPISPSYGLRYSSNYGPPTHPTYDQSRFRFNPEALVFIPGAITHPDMGELTGDESIISVKLGRRGLNPATPPFVPASTVHDQLMNLFHGENGYADTAPVMNPVSHPNQELLVHDN
jgi:hypothetical protein